MTKVQMIKTVGALAALFAVASLSGCATTPPKCGLPAQKNLDAAFSDAKTNLQNGCEAHFDAYMDELLRVAEGDPKPQNKQKFSDFLLWSADQGLLSRRQAETKYNRFFNVKFVSMMGDYNNCAHTCPRKSRVLLAMEQELTDKERGLVKVSEDTASYYRADQLFQETELVLEATCTACSAAR